MTRWREFRTRHRRGSRTLVLVAIKRMEEGHGIGLVRGTEGIRERPRVDPYHRLDGAPRGDGAVLARPVRRTLRPSGWDRPRGVRRTTGPVPLVRRPSMDRTLGIVRPRAVPHR